MRFTRFGTLLGVGLLLFSQVNSAPIYPQLVFSSSAIAAAPVFTKQPANQVVMAGKAVKFTVKASSTLKLTYHWQISTDNGENWNDEEDAPDIRGFATASLQLAKVSAINDDGKQFRCVVEDTAENLVISEPATLNVLAPARIATPPTNQTGIIGQNVTLSVEATGTEPLIYQWYKGTSPLPGATSANLTLTNLQKSDAGKYSVKVTNAFGNDQATTKLDLQAPIVITEQPQDTTTLAGQVVIFNIAATGPGTLTYNWQAKPVDSSNWAGISNDSSGTVIFIDNGSGDPVFDWNTPGTDVVECIVSGPNNQQVTSDVAQLTILAVPQITSPPQDLSQWTGSEATFSVVANDGGGNDTLTYQWSKNGTPLPGQTDSTLDLPSITPADAGTYTVAVSNPNTTIQASASLNVTALGGITSPPPKLLRVVVGKTASFTVEANGNSPVTYQWYKGKKPISGATDATLELDNINGGDAGTYTVTVTSQYGVSRASSVLHVLPEVIITQQPVSQNYHRGLPADFHVKAEGPGPLKYRWQYSTDNGTTWIYFFVGGNLLFPSLTDVPGVAGTDHLHLNPAVAEFARGTTFRCLITNDYQTSLPSDFATLR